MRVAMAQIDPTVGDLDGNARMIRETIDDAARLGADFVAFPELAVTGYPPQDLLAERAFVRKNRQVLARIIAGNPDVAGVVGFVDADRSGRLFNAAAVFEGRRLVAVVRKTLLPTYDVFDEDRYFGRGTRHDIRPVPLRLGGRKVRVGVEICEDLWDPYLRLVNVELRLAHLFGVEVPVPRLRLEAAFLGVNHRLNVLALRRRLRRGRGHQMVHELHRRPRASSPSGLPGPTQRSSRSPAALPSPRATAPAAQSSPAYRLRRRSFRAEKAKLLGYANFAAWDLEDRDGEETRGRR